MRYLDEYRDAGAARGLASQIRAMTTRPWAIMEICGGQTHTIVEYALEEMLPDSLTLVHGPGCPVCVTPLEMIDRAIAIASRPGSSSPPLATCSACLAPRAISSLSKPNTGA